MKPLNLIALLLFLGGAVWALTRSERVVRDIQSSYFSAISPFLSSGSKLETTARDFLKEVEHSKVAEAKLETVEAEIALLATQGQAPPLAPPPANEPLPPPPLPVG